MTFELRIGQNTTFLLTLYMLFFYFFQVSAMLSSTELESTGSKGHCVSFSYAMDGLSVDKLRVLLQPVTNDDKTKDKSETSEVEFF